MHIVISLILILFFGFMLWRALQIAARLAWWLGLRGCLALALGAAGAAFWLAPSPEQPSSAAAYRAAGAALERATGQPCDYACKVRLADMTRQPLQ